jgi:hypothetical protein
MSRTIPLRNERRDGFVKDMAGILDGAEATVKANIGITTFSGSVKLNLGTLGQLAAKDAALPWEPTSRATSGLSKL